ncbi:hypothetical protein HU200_031018 [Digitaria exilis]|uniref:Uncharacterized protein n=1 Tax=Digitaria exilis TaxID=1010633 RepID=A0A835BQX2_9POAL|nr:hypothetical protein HU200_031018 [Digitaria exilis]CAB3476025.1 unnamed protein product [Digitaria exilis]
MAAPPEMRYPGRAIDDRRRGVLLDSGRALMLLGALVLITCRRLLAGCDNAEHVLAGFALWLLGVGLATLSLVAGHFPRLAAAAAPLATALRG